MNLKQIRAFTEVMNTGSVSEAARRLHRSQPAVSAVIASLESELEMSLFIRKGMRLRPTPEAYFFLREAKEILGRIENAQNTMRAIRQREQGELEIVTMPGPTVFLLPDLINRFLKNRKNIKVSLITKSSPVIEQIISAQNSDIGFADFDLLDVYEESLVTHDIFDFNCLCAMQAGDSLEGESLITPELLKGKPMATLYPDHPVTIQTVKAFESYGLELNANFCARSFVPLLVFVASGSAYSVVDRITVECYLKQNRKKSKIVFRPFSPEVILRTSVITPNHRPMSLLARQFHKVFKQSLREIQKQDA